MSKFKRENRYLVLKRKDIEKYLNREDKMRLNRISRDIANSRTDDEKPPLECVVVESDWPIYDSVWAMVEDFATNHKEGNEE